MSQKRLFAAHIGQNGILIIARVSKHNWYEEEYSIFFATHLSIKWKKEKILICK